MLPSVSEQVLGTLRRDVESRIRAGETGVLEQVFDETPELQNDLEAALDLIYVEITTREELGRPVELQELERRFPQWSDRIKRLLSVHHALQLDSLEFEGDTKRLDQDTDMNLLGEYPHAVHHFEQYELFEEVGRGGMGVVYRARQKELNRIVALKVIREVLGSGEQGKRLIREAKTVARLDHSNIVRVFDAGYDSQIPYICLEYVEGGSLASQLSQSTMDAKAACGLLQQLAEAIGYAHSQGVIHRDLKPANVLLDLHGRPKIADFGLAKSVWEQAEGAQSERLTQTGAILGSLCYMSPEQVSGQDEHVGVATDVYGLGTILYETLIGRPPFVRESPLDTAYDIQYREAVSPRLFVPTIPRDVETICLKCLEKTASRRYATAHELSEDLERFLTGQAVRARPVGKISRAIKWMRRRPAVAVLLSCIVALPLAYGGLQKRYADDISVFASQLKTALAGEAAARQVADQHFWRAFEGVASVQRKLASTGLEHEPRMQKARLEIVDDAIGIIRGLEHERPEEIRLQTEKAELNKLRGRILLELGRREEALDAFSGSITLYETLLERSPSDFDFRHSWASAVAGKAETQKWLMRYELAVESYEEAATELQLLSKISENLLPVQNDLVQTLSGWADVLDDSQRTGEAEAVLVEADRQSLLNVQQWPKSSRTQSVRAQILWALGRIARKQGDYSQAEAYAVRSTARFEQALQLAPGDRNYQNFLVEVGMFHANQLQALHKFEQAKVPLEQAEKLLVELRGRYPSITRFRELSIAIIREQSLLEVNLGHDKRAVELSKQALDLRRETFRDNPKDNKAIFEFAGSLANLANRLVGSESLGESRLKEAEDYAGEALAVCESLPRESIENKQLRRFALYGLSLALARQNKNQAARDALELLTEETSSAPMDLRYLADGWSELLSALSRSGHEEMMDEVTNRALDELERAIDAGYRDVFELESNPALDLLRDAPRFDSLLGRAGEHK